MILRNSHINTFTVILQVETSIQNDYFCLVKINKQNFTGTEFTMLKIVSELFFDVTRLQLTSLKMTDCNGHIHTALVQFHYIIAWGLD